MNIAEAQLYEALFNQTAIPISVVKANAPKFTIVALNEQYKKSSRIVRDDFIGKNAFDVYKPWDKASEEQFSLLKNGLMQAIEEKRLVKLPVLYFEIAAEDGITVEQIWWQIEITPILDPQGKAEYLMCVIQNITEQYLSRLAIQEATQKEQQLRRELASVNEQLATMNEELYASNEELLSVNEELASTNEELTTINNELIQSKFDLQKLNMQLEERVASRTAQLLAAQAEQNNQHERLERFFMQAPAGICILDGPNMVFELINPSYQQLFPGRNLLGKPLLEAVPEMEGQDIYNILRDVYNTGITFEGNELCIPLARYDNGPIDDRYFNFIYQARLDVNGNTDGIVVFVFEVTDLVLTRRKVEDSEKRLTSLLNAMPQIAWTNTPDGEVDFFNQRWYDYTGLDFEQTKTWGWETVIHPDDLQYNLSIYKSILNSNKSGEFEIREKGKDGIYRWHLIKIEPIKNEQGEILIWIGTATNIDELKHLQQQKDDFISIASHELKTPITSLKASLQLLERVKDTPSTPIFSKLVSQASKSMQKISALVEDLLNVSKINQGQLKLSKTTFTLSHMINSCCNHVKLAGEFNLIFEGDIDLQVYADEHQVDQVVVNLVNNAIKYAPNSKNIFLIIEKAGQMAKVSVKDSGNGIPPDKLKNLFDRYYRADNSGNQASGLGLGLYISSEIIKRHGGEIGVESELGKGSTFWFTLPLK